MTAARARRFARGVVLAAALTGCASHQLAISGARFANRPAVWRVDDRGDVAVQPASRPFAQKVYFFDAYVYDAVAHRMRLPEPRYALDVNALDEVPDSTWFENRIGRHELTPDDIRRGPNHIEADGRTWKIIQSKTVGGSAGFIALDGRGDRYVLKLDEPHAPVTESATDVVVQRLLWAIGYHVPENSVLYVRADQFVRDPKAVVKDEFGNERAMTDRDIEAMLARGYKKPDGTYRMLASKYLAGKPLGGWPQRGVRTDDPNDRIPHEHMRVVRALYLFFAWLQQTDVKEDNTLDMWTEDKANKTHHVRHYLVDFGKSLGMSAWIVPRPGDGHQQNVDYHYLLRGLLSFGLWVRPFEGTLTPGIQGVGTFDAEHYDPLRWEPHANYVPLYFLDDRDLLWAAKILLRFTPAHIRAAVEQGRYEDPRAVDYITEVLVERLRITGRAVLSRVAALDRFTVAATPAGTALCFDDLLVSYGLLPGAHATTSYTATAFGHAGDRLGVNRTAPPAERGREGPLAWTASAAAGADRTACFAGVPSGGERERYTIVRIATERAGVQLAPVEVHLASDPQTQALRIIGIHRQR